MAQSSRARSRVRRLAATGAAAATLTLGLSWTLGTETGGPASADALCDQMRAQYGSNWPCINVPTYTPPPTQNEPAPTAPGQTEAPNNGPGIGGSPGLGPGEGNRTPIVPGPQGGQVPQVPGRQSAPAQIDPGQRVPAQPGATQAPAPVTIEPAPNEATPEVDKAFQPLPGVQGPSGSDSGGIPVPAWLLLGAAALVAGAPRSLLRRGGSTRGQVGPSRMVLIHDETSPNTYRFAMNVPDGGTTKINPTGSATVYDRDGNAVRKVARPWAFDAAGHPQRTWYEVDDNDDFVPGSNPQTTPSTPSSPTQLEKKLRLPSRRNSKLSVRPRRVQRRSCILRLLLAKNLLIHVGSRVRKPPFGIEFRPILR